MSGPLFASLSYEQVVRKYAQNVTSVCVMNLRNWADAEDCFQNTFMSLYTKDPDFESEDHLKAWLIRVAINERNSLWRKRSRLVHLYKINNEVITFDELVNPVKNIIIGDVDGDGDLTVKDANFIQKQVAKIS